jgi:hypothetical protein
MPEEQISELIELINKREELFGKNSDLSLPLRVVRTLLKDIQRLNSEVDDYRVVLAEADDFARKLTALIRKHFPDVDPGMLKETDARIGQILERLPHVSEGMPTAP